VKVKLTYIFSCIENSLAFEWMAENINTDKFDVQYVFLNPVVPAIATKFIAIGYNVVFIPYRKKSDSLSAGLALIKMLVKNRPDIVHTHLFDASLIALPIAKLLGIKKRIHTRHHSSFHHQYHPHAVKYDRFINSCSTQIVAITKNVADILIDAEKVPKQKVFIVNHGFDFADFSEVDNSRIDVIKAKYNPEKRRPVIGVISRFTAWKGIQFIIPAFAKLVQQYPESLLVLANANGDYKTEIELLLKQLPEHSYKVITFEPDVIALYSLFDVFVHVPIDAHSEAFGQVYVEALAAHLPCVFTLSGVANDFIVDGVNAVVVPFQDVEAIQNAVIKIISTNDFANHISEQGAKDVRQLFGIKRMIADLEKVYES